MLRSDFDKLVPGDLINFLEKPQPKTTKETCNSCGVNVDKGNNEFNPFLREGVQYLAVWSKNAQNYDEI